MITTIIGSVLIALGISIIISSFLIFNKKGVYMFISGFVIGIIGIGIYPKNPPSTIELKPKRFSKYDETYLRGYKDGIKDCGNKLH